MDPLVSLRRWPTSYHWRGYMPGRLCLGTFTPITQRISWSPPSILQPGRKETKISLFFVPSQWDPKEQDFSQLMSNELYILACCCRKRQIVIWSKDQKYMQIHLTNSRKKYNFVDVYQNLWYKFLCKEEYILFCLKIT